MSRPQPISSMVEQDLKFSFKRQVILNHSGQAVVEYILLLVISVGLIMGASKAFKGLNSFMDSYIGDYTICLMEYGELPTLGVEETALKTHVGASGCDKKFASFTFGSGRPSVGGSGSGSGRGGSGKSGAGGSSKNSSSSANKASNNNGSDDSDASGKKRGLRSGGSSAYAKGQINRSNDLGTADSQSGAGNKKAKIIEEDGGGEESPRRRYGGSNSNSSAFANSRIKYKAIRGVLAEEIKKRSPKIPRAPARTVVAVSSQAGNQFGPYKKTFTPPEPPRAETKQDDGSSFSFGNILRWLIIGGMIIAIIVFFGGQIMNYSNSKD